MDNRERVKILIEALPYMRRFAGKTVVIKYGGKSIESEEMKAAVIDDVVLLRQMGVNVVLVHGGGAEINAWLEKVGIEPKFIDGLRYTDDDTMQIVQMVLAGKINKELSSQFAVKGVKALGLCGLDSGILKARCKTDASLGRVGEVYSVSAGTLKALLAQGFMPVISTIGQAEDGSALNINADTAAAAIAVALAAEKLVLLTDTAGVLMDKDDESTIIRKIQASEVDEYKRKGIISGGMLPKMDCCYTAVSNGVKDAAIIDGRVSHAILTHMFSEDYTGTMIV